jgi:hypothetical protein
LSLPKLYFLRWPKHSILDLTPTFLFQGPPSFSSAFSSVFFCSTGPIHLWLSVYVSVYCLAVSLVFLICGNASQVVNAQFMFIGKYLDYVYFDLKSGSITFFLME